MKWPFTAEEPTGRDRAEHLSPNKNLRMKEVSTPSVVRSRAASAGAIRHPATHCFLNLEPVAGDWGGLFLGSSGNSGERRADFEEEIPVIAEAIGHPLDDRDLVVDSL